MTACALTASHDRGNTTLLDLAGLLLGHPGATRDPAGMTAAGRLAEVLQVLALGALRVQFAGQKGANALDDRAYQPPSCDRPLMETHP